MEALKQFHFKATNGKKSFEMEAHSLGTINKVKEAMDALGVNAVVTDQFQAAVDTAVEMEVERRLAELAKEQAKSA